MSNKNKTIALASLIAAGAGVAAVAASNSHKQAKAKKIAEKQQAESGTPYRNTERGKYEKNSKGIYYTNGNYEAFAHPKKPEGVDEKSAYIVGSGLASLAAACFLVRDGQMPDRTYNIDLCGYPHEEEEILPPKELIQQYQEKRASLNADIDRILAQITEILGIDLEEE